MNHKKIWLVTGASKGLGLALVKQLLEQGYGVAATSRSLSSLEEAVAYEGSNFLPLVMDLGSEESVQEAVTAATAHFGRLDVVVNNAGYGLVGGLEELSDAEARANFEVNVFGVLHVIRQVLPQMRKQGGGHIFNIASIGGFTGAFPGFGIYCATKFAMHGFSESLAAEAAGFGIKVTIVSPGYFRTDFLAGSLATPAAPIDAYTTIRETQALHQGDYNGNQAGDPVKAASVMIAAAEQERAPLHLFLGKDAYAMAAQKMQQVQEDLALMEALATGTDF